MKKAVIIGMLVYAAANRIAVEYRARKAWDRSYQDFATWYYENTGGASILPKKGVYMVLGELAACTIGIPLIAVKYFKGDLM